MELSILRPFHFSDGKQKLTLNIAKISRMYM